MEHTIIYARAEGARGDGRTKDTAVLQSCIDRCHSLGGGTVVVEQGDFVCGTLYLKSRVTLEVRASAVLRASPDIADYGEDTHHNRYRNEHDMDRCWLYAQDGEDITITGGGELNGNAKAFPYSI